MRDIPIIFSAPMVRALLEGRKTMTRRLAWRDLNTKKTGRIASGLGKAPSPWQRVKSGDRLWVRESIQRFERQPRATAQYVADITGVPHRGVVEGWCDGRAYWQWERPKVPSIHMPRWASRLTLMVTGTKIEPLQDISEADARAEGVCLFVESLDRPNSWEGLSDADRNSLVRVNFGSAAKAFNCLFDGLHPAGTWESNPEVVALTFTVHKSNIDALRNEEAA